MHQVSQNNSPLALQSLRDECTLGGFKEILNSKCFLPDASDSEIPLQEILWHLTVRGLQNPFYGSVKCQPGDGRLLQEGGPC